MNEETRSKPHPRSGCQRIGESGPCYNFVIDPFKFSVVCVVNAYTRAAQFKGLPAESSYKLQRVGGNVLGMLN